jgi:hypothetical protein
MGKCSLIKVLNRCPIVPTTLEPRSSFRNNRDSSHQKNLLTIAFLIVVWKYENSSCQKDSPCVAFDSPCGNYIIPSCQKDSPCVAFDSPCGNYIIPSCQKDSPCVAFDSPCGNYIIPSCQKDSLTIHRLIAPEKSRSHEQIHDSLMPRSGAVQ